MSDVLYDSHPSLVRMKPISTTIAVLVVLLGVTVAVAGGGAIGLSLGNEQYDKLFVQMIRYSMRPITESANFSVAAESKDGIARIVVTALDDNEEFLDFLEMSGRGINSSSTIT